MKRDLKNLSHHLDSCICRHKYRTEGLEDPDCIWCTDSQEIVIAQKETATGYADWIAHHGFVKNKTTGKWGRTRFTLEAYTSDELYEIYNLPFNTNCNKDLIEDVHDFNSVASDMVVEFMQSLDGNPEFSHEPTEEELESFGGEDISCIYNSKAMALCERYVKRLTAVGAQYFDENEIEIQTGVIEP